MSLKHDRPKTTSRLTFICSKQCDISLLYLILTCIIVSLHRLKVGLSVDSKYT